jgi:exoribonuclease II
LNKRRVTLSIIAGIPKSIIVDSVEFLNTTVQQGANATLQCRITTSDERHIEDDYNFILKKIENKEKLLYANQTVLFWRNEEFQVLKRM